MMRRTIHTLLMLLLLAGQAFATDRYVRSTDGSDSDDGSTWALAKATLAGAFTASSAGDRIFVSDNHAETQASAMTLTSPGTAASPVQVICVDDSAEPPTARATTATISTTGANSITFAGAGGATTAATQFYGITFNCGDGSTAADVIFSTASSWFFDTCPLKLLTTATASDFTIGSAGTIGGLLVELKNSPLTFSHASQTITAVVGTLVWRDTASAVSGTAPNTLFAGANERDGTDVTLRGVDLSAVTGTLVSGGGRTGIKARIINCKLGSGVTLGAGSTGFGGTIVEAINCDSADTNYRYHKGNYQGTVTSETTIVRTGGATDGTTPISRKMVSTANSKIYSPLEGEPILVWCDSTAAQTFTVDVITDGVTLTNAEAWVQAEYLGTSGFPLGVTVTDAVADPIFGTPANQTADSDSTWTTTGLSSPVEQELSVSFTPQEKGWVWITPILARASTTMYYCPKVSPPSNRQWMTPSGMINEGGQGSIFRGVIR